jgi:Helicase conserved C-terminal domain
MKNRDLFQRRIMGLVSYYWVKDNSYPAMIDKGMVRVPMSEYQFHLYQIVRAEEKAREKSAMKKKRAGLQSKSMFRVFSREFSNFVFPEDIVRPFPNPDFEKLIQRAIKGRKSSNRMSSSVAKAAFALEEATNEDENESRIKLNKMYMTRIHQTIEALRAQSAQYLTGDGLATYSPKMRAILDNMSTSPGKIFLYSQFTMLEGAQVMSLVLDAAGYHRYGTPGDGPAYALFTGQISFEERAEMIQVYNAADNVRGERLKVLIASSAGAEGLDLKCVRQIHILDPYWNEVKMEQVIGRGVRRNSHIELPESERTVEVYRYLAVFSENQAQRSSEPESTDEHVYGIAYKKALIKNELLQILQESAVDCQLNKADNMKVRPYKCFNYGNEAKGIGYIPDIHYDAVASSGNRRSRVVIRAKLVKGVVTKMGQVLIGDKEKRAFYKATDILHETEVPLQKSTVAKVVYVDVENRKVYDYKAMKESKETLMLGSFNDNGEFASV